MPAIIAKIVRDQRAKSRLSIKSELKKQDRSRSRGVEVAAHRRQRPLASCLHLTGSLQVRRQQPGDNAALVSFERSVAG
jgi:hypothetical protein